MQNIFSNIRAVYNWTGFKKWRYYKKGIKIVPHNIETFLTPLALAI